jgi:hypothetical protein
MRFTIVPFFVLCVSCSSMNAQSDGGKGKQTRPATEISVVALGAKPQRKYRESAGAESPIMIMSKPGQTPPSRLYFKGPSKEDKKATWKTFSIPFNNPSAMRAVPPGQELVLHRKLPNDGGYEKYITIPAGVEGSRRIFFLLPSTKGPTPWKKPPLIRTIAVDSKSLKGKQFILKNLSHFTVQHAFEKSVTIVSPMETISYKRANKGELYRLAAQYGTKKKIIYNTAVRLNGDGHIHLFALYDASPKTNSGRSVGVFKTMIPARKLPELAPKP